MKTRLLFFFCLFTFTFYISRAQVPQGFNYQAIARDGETLIKDKNIGVRIAVLSSIVPLIVQWEEEHIAHTNSYGLFQIIIGDPEAAHIGGLAGKFTDIDWTINPLYLRTTLDIKSDNNWVVMGDAQMVSVPYALVTQNVSGLKKLSVAGKSTSMNEAIFAVRNNSGDTVFAIYNEGIRAHVGGAGTKGVKGGFAVGGFGTKGGQDYLRVYPDSTRVYVKNAAKGVKGGFAVGGYGTKGPAANYMDLTKNNYFIGHESGSKINGGLYNSVIGFQAGKNLTGGGYNTILGFNAGINASSGNNNILIGNYAGNNLTSGIHNTLIGNSAGFSHTDQMYNVMIGTSAGSNINSSGASGSWNTFLGINAGFKIRTSRDNTFIGTNAGYMLESGGENTIVGIDAGRGGDDDPYNYYGYSSSKNTIIGNKAGRNLKNGNGNVLIGYGAGHDETTSNKLHISNTIKALPGDPPIVPLLYGDFATKQLGINTLTLTRTMNVGGDIGVTGNVYATTVVANLSGNVSGNVTGNVTGDLTGKTNGVEMGKIFLVDDGIIQELMGGDFLLSYLRGAKQIVLINKNKDFACTYWFRRTDREVSVTGSGTLIENQSVQIMPAEIKNELGFEIHFGDTADGKGYCSVWFQVVNGVLTGHYMKY